MRRWQRRLADEREEAQVYRDLAGRRSGSERDVLLGLAEAEERHEAHWEGLLGTEGGDVGRGSLRLRLLALLARRFGAVFTLALVQRAESRSPYDQDADATPAMAADERIHEEVVRALAAQGRARVSGSFRAAVFGANDGLVSNLALVLGVAGGGATTATILLTGLSGLLAGALSMGAGEFISVRSQRELLAASTPDPQARLAIDDLDIDANELALVYRARGASESEAKYRADAVLRKRSSAEHLEPEGADQGEIVGTGIKAALSSFVFFATGALIPVLPFMVGLPESFGLVVAMVLVGLALLLTGGAVGLLSGAPPLRRGVRQLAIGAAAAGVTYALGLVFGSTAG